MIWDRLLKTILGGSLIIFFSVFLLIPSCIQTNYNKTGNSVNIFNLFEKITIEGIKSTVVVNAFAPARPASGSGVIISQDGYIITNNHVVEASKDVHVILANGDKYEAKIIGADKKTDVALLKIDVSFPVPAAKLGNSDNVLVGSWVIAIGSPFGLTNSVSVGIVSGKNRELNFGPYNSYIQTDASINPGSSGGPLFNLAGEVIGINTLIYTDKSKEIKINIGVGFAIPINMVKDIIKRLKEDGKVIRSSFGIVIQQISCEIQKELGLKNRDGAIVISVGKGSAAEKGGLQIDDIIIKVGDKKVSNSISKVSFMISMMRPGEKVAVIVIRDGKEKRLIIKVNEMVNPEKVSEIISRIEKSLGFTVGPITPQVVDDLSLEDKDGVVILEVEEKSSAAWAGIKNNDIIISIDRKKVKNMADYKEIMRKLDSKKQILLVIKRDDVTAYKVVKRR